MVVFTCNNCGDSLHKPKVAKHYQFQCRNSISLTCVDCFKDFLGNDYIAHTKCVTEAERYGSKDYVAKPSMNKGERKQLNWIKMINNILNGTNNLSKDERNILEYISKHENIPRKKRKFLNFVQSSMGHRVNINVVESCWNKIEKATSDMQNNKESIDVKENEENIKNTNVHNDNNGVNDVEKNEQVKKSKKRKYDELNDNENHIDQPKIKSNDNEIQNNNNLHIDTQLKESSDKPKNKFDWKSCILHVLDSKPEITLDKLEKKVVNKCLKNSDNLTHEKAVIRFHKKLKKISEISVNDNIVKRIS